MTDLNAVIAYLLDDLALVQEAKQSAWGYQRAAHVVLLMEAPITTLLQADGQLPKIPNIGPKSLRVITEVLETGASPTVEAAVEKSGQSTEITRRRSLRVNFLSRAKVIAALADDSLAGPTSADYRGDFQMHSTGSDGKLSVAEMAQACLARGYQFSAITDHSHGLAVAHGMSVADLARQREEIDRVNRELDGRFLLFAGVEANIGPDGSLDLSREELASIDVVVAAPHSALRSGDDQTARMVAAVETPGVHILGHPRGRQRGNRAGIAADWDAIFAAAARSGVAVEIDGDPSRQDLDFEIARRALHAGCVFALDSDAHSAAELGYVDIAIAHARLAGISPDRVVNCWPLDRLLSWLGDR